MVSDMFSVLLELMNIYHSQCDKCCYHIKHFVIVIYIFHQSVLLLVVEGGLGPTGTVTMMEEAPCY